MGVSPVWLATLHQAWVIENTHAPGLLLRLLRDAPLPTPDTLRTLASGLFPMEMLADVSRAAVFLHGQERGLDTLLPLTQGRLTDIRVHHANADELETLRATYDQNWHYDPLPVTASGIDADLILIDPPALTLTAYVCDQLGAFLGNYSGSLMLAISGHLLNQLKCDADQPNLFGERLGRLLERSVTCQQIVFRNSDPEDMFWACLDVGARSATA